MRGVVVIMGICGLALGGCRSAPEQSAGAAAPRGEVRAQVVGGEASVQAPAARPVESLRGRVLSVNPRLRFVIIDFPTGKLPMLDQRLSLWRSDMKVAEVKISGPYRGTTVAADITAGEALPGDMARED